MGAAGAHARGVTRASTCTCSDIGSSKVLSSAFTSTAPGLRCLASALTLFALAAVACGHVAPAQARRGPQRSHARGQRGAFHHVRAGETLWRIAHTYGVPLDTIARTLNGALPSEVGDIVLNLTFEANWINSTITNFAYNNYRTQMLLTKRWEF